MEKFFNKTQKSPEKLQAQTEVFAEHGIHPRIESIKEINEMGERQKEFKDKNPNIDILDYPENTLPFARYYRELNEQATMLKHSDMLAAITDINNLPKDIPKELVSLIKNQYPQYLTFLRKEKSTLNKLVEKNIETYNKKFKEIVSSIKEQIKNTEAQDVSSYLSEGTQNFAFKVSVDGSDFVIKIPKGDFAVEMTVVNKEIKAMMRGADLSNLSHLQAYSYPDNVTVFNYIDGVNFEHLKKEERNKISNQTIQFFIKTIKEMKKRGIRPDVGAEGNFIFNEKEEIIYIIDYTLNDGTDTNYKKSKKFCIDFFGEEKKKIIDKSFSLFSWI